MQSIRVMVVDDYEQIYSYFKMIINSENDMEVVAVATSGEEAVEKALRLKPDIILMDIQMETDTAGIRAVEKIKQECPEIKIIVLTIHNDDDLILDAYIAGVNDYLIKTSSVVTIIDSIRKLYNHDLSIRPEMSEKILDGLTKLNDDKKSLLYILNLLVKLTPAEISIIKEVYNGNSYKQIAKKRFVQEVTVRTQVNHILAKMKFKRMKDLIKHIKDMNLMEFFKDV